MLVLTRGTLESFFVGDTKITVVKVRGDKVRLSIDAPRNVRVRRTEIEEIPQQCGPLSGFQEVHELPEFAQ